MPDRREVYGLGDRRSLALKQLRLDAENPRLPPNLRGADQETLAVHLDLGFDAFTVAESIATHGFFNSEPLIVIPDEQNRGLWIVVEGNRRLSALVGLANKDVRGQFAEPNRWEELARKAPSPVTPDVQIPVVVVKSRKDVVPIVGFRHISGILQWTPYAQARYVAKLIDEDGMSIAEVAQTIGIDKTKAGNLYRDQAIARQASKLGLETGPLEQAFSLLTVAMGNVQLRDHIGAPLASKLEPGADPVPPNRVSELKELLTWVFGHEETPPLVTDSRQIGRLATVVGSEAGLAALRSGETLENAHQKIQDAVADPKVRLMQRLKTARNSARAAKDDLPSFAENQDARTAVEEIRDAVDALLEIVDGG
jgi:hypothetical protein